MFSERFQRTIVISTHAKIPVAEREISETMLLEVIDTGDTCYKDTNHLWAFKDFPERHDNLLCAVLILEDSVVANVKIAKRGVCPLSLRGRVGVGESVRGGPGMASFIRGGRVAMPVKTVMHHFSVL